MKSKLALFLYIVGLTAITFWAYPIVTDRYFSSEEKDSQDGSIPSTVECTGDTVCNINLEGNSNKGITSSEDDLEITPDIMPESTESSNAFLEISKMDCDSECTSFKNTSEKNYCLQVCGLSTSVKPTNDGCETLAELEKDYCWKSEAVEKTDFSICKKIEDSKIREVCQNRITEDIIDNQKIEN